MSGLPTILEVRFDDALTGLPELNEIDDLFSGTDREGQDGQDLW